MFRDWIRDRRDLIDELEELREMAVAVDRMLENAVADRDHFNGLLCKEKAAHEQTQRLLESLEQDASLDVFAPATPRTPEQELALMRVQVAALEERVHRLQQANMAFDQRR